MVLMLPRFYLRDALEDFIDLVVPELQKRGIYKTEYESGTYREKLFGTGRNHLSNNHTAAKFRKGVPVRV
jgi:hypothetical protein